MIGIALRDRAAKRRIQRPFGIAGIAIAGMVGPDLRRDLEAAQQRRNGIQLPAVASSPEGLRAMVALAVIRDDVIKPLLASNGRLKRARRPVKEQRSVRQSVPGIDKNFFASPCIAGQTLFSLCLCEKISVSS